MSAFGTIRSTDVRSLAGPVVDIEVSAGTELVQQGAVVGTFFLIRSGTAVLLQDGYSVGILGAGECFGEIDPLGREPQSYTVVAGSRLRLVTFSSFGIGRLCDALPGARQRIEDALPHDTAEVHPALV